MALKVVVGQKIMTDVVHGCAASPAPAPSTNATKPRKDFWRILIVDKYATRIISSCCKVHDLAVEGILVIENIQRKREPFPKWEAIYLVSPTETSVNAIIQDFNDPNKIMYSTAHIFFTDVSAAHLGALILLCVRLMPIFPLISVCPDDLFEKLGKAKCANRIQTVKEIDMAFLPYESQVFTLDSPEVFKLYYGIPKALNDKIAETMDRMAEQIATLCATLNEFPFIRYSNYGNSEYNLKLAETIQKKLNIYKQSHAPTMGSSSVSSRSQLLILDRSFDCVSPLLHELTFQAMAYDLLPINNDSYKYTEAAPGGSKEKEIYLDETDDLWRELRHKHIGTVSQQIAQAVKNFSASKKSMMKNAGDANMADLSKMIRDMPQYQKELKKYLSSSRVAEDCAKDSDRIRLLCKVEQDLAMTTDEYNEPIKDYMSILNPVLMDSIGVRPEEKLRVILLYLLTQNGIPRERLEKLMQHGDINNSHLPTLMNLELLGVNVTNENKNNTKSSQVPHCKVREKKDGEKEINIFQRWEPTVKYILEDLMNGKLDAKQFPYLPGRELSSGASKAQAVSARFGNWQKAGPGSSAAAAVSNLPRLIVFIAGGITFSEMRCAYELSESKDYDVVIGSTNIITPSQFLEQLKELKAA